jgi:hypothetical protein
MAQMSDEKRIRRVIILCCSFAKNLAYSRGFSDDADQALKASSHPHADVWRVATNNFLDVAVMEWCKLMADPKDRHYWGNVVNNPKEFETELLSAVAMTGAEYDAYKVSMRRYRDKFLAHLDDDEVMHIPQLDPARKAVWVYYSAIVSQSDRESFHGYPASLGELQAGYDQCVALAKACAQHAGARRQK